MNSISIAMCTYNGALYLREQLESLLALELMPKELVVGDDGSTDDTLAILAEFASRAPFPVIVTKNPKQLGYGENFLQTANRCTGKWVAFCDQDDKWLPEKLTRCAEAIASGPPDLGLVVHAAVIGDRNLKEIGRTNWPKPGLYRRLSLPPDWLVAGFLQVIRRSLLTDIPFRERRIPWIGEPDAHDAWSCLVASVAGSVAVLGDYLAIYRRHETNTAGEASFARRTFRERVLGKLRDNSAEYIKQARRYREIAEYLSDRARDQRSLEREDQFLSASREIAAFADRVSIRAQINARSSLKKRAEAYARLLRAGAYSAKHRWGFGAAEATVDLARIFIPAG